MMKRSALSLLAVATFAALLFAAGCGEAVDDTVEEVGDEIEKATD
jgi:protein involved in sex pheromone biosynthesis